MVLNILAPLQIAAKSKTCCTYRIKGDLKIEKEKKELLKNSARTPYSWFGATNSFV